MIEAEGKRVVVPFEVSDDQTSAGNLFIYLSAKPLDYFLKGDVLVVGNGAQRELMINNKSTAEGTGKVSVVVTDADEQTATHAFQANFGGDPRSEKSLYHQNGRPRLPYSQDSTLMDR